MRKIILFNMVSVDGFFAGPKGEIDWHTVDEEFNQFAIEQLDSADGLIFGRVTYEMMASYWPTPVAIQDDQVVAGKMNSIRKYVFSRALKTVDWANTSLVKGDAGEELRKLKQQGGRDLLIFGSANLAAAFTQKGLIDEYRMMVSPVVLGNGIPLFQGVKERIPLKLLRARTFGNGNILEIYQPG